MKNRIQNIIDKYGLSSNTFAQEIEVNRSTISHILSGRNKPSIEVLQKILRRFPDVSATWLLLGQGAIDDANLSSSVTQDLPKNSIEVVKSVRKIVVLYSDNSFEEYMPNK